MKLERLAGLGVTLFLPVTLGCSDPVPPPPQASRIFGFKSPIGTQGCGFANTGSAQIGGPPRSFAGDPGPRAVDGQDGASISCRVSGSGSFAVSGRAVHRAAS